MGGSRLFSSSDFDAARLAAAKGAQFVSVCLPARDEEATVGAIVSTVRRELVDAVPLVDEVLVVDDGSFDATAAVAADAGATVVGVADVLPACGAGRGKGNALWKALGAAKGDLVVFCDTDVRGFDASFVTGLVGPLLADPGIGFVKGFYQRSLDGVAGAGGRVTELVARPALALLFPELASVRQPIGGEMAARRAVLEQVPFVEGYGVDLGLLIDVVGRFGPEVMAEVDLGTRVHRNRPLDELAPQALVVLRTALDRAGMDMSADACVERPPIVEVEAYRRRG
ncbi:MAG: glucosyl-3-phosphoglycerate synthase [Acidimicrobiales bacterium]